MATTKLTPRQREIKDLLDAGDTPADVAKKLKINENTIYQHLRRMKTGAKKTTTRRSTARKSTTRSRSGTTRRTAASGSKRSTTRRSSTRKTATRKTSTRRGGGRAPAAAPAAPIEVRSMTPLQAIRNRREYIEQEIKESAKRLEAATKAFEAEADAHGKLEASRADELKKLAGAEAALSDAKAKPKRSRSGASKNGAGSKAAAAKAAQAAPAPAAAAPAPQAEPAPAPAAPEPVEPPQGDEALAAVGAVEQERPGVETVPEFSQEGEDAFEGDGSAE